RWQHADLRPDRAGLAPSRGARHRGPRRQPVRWTRARRSRAQRLRHPRRNLLHLAGRPAARRRPRHPRGHPVRADAGRPGVAVPQKGRGTGGTSGSRPLAVKVRHARRRKPSSTEWLSRQLNDPFVAEAHRLGYRSRAAFKLIQLDDRFRLLRPGMRLVDLVCAPGGWAQIAAARVGAEGDLLAGLKRAFAAVRHAKPAASRAESAETYVVATGFRGPPAA